MAKKRVIVTGGSGKAGHWVIKDLLESGYDVLNVDTRRPAQPLCRTIVADLTQLGQVVSAFSPHVTGDRTPYLGVVHFGAIARPGETPNDELFRVNALGTYNVFEACGLLGIRKVVAASSESSYGMAFSNEVLKPLYLPVDEEHPQRPEDTYGLSKVVNEVTAQMFHRRDGTQILFYRISHVLTPDEHAEAAGLADRLELRERTLWAYVDARDVATACRLGLEKDGLGCEAIMISSEITAARVPSAELQRRFLPGVTDVRAPITGHQAFYSTEKARRLLGWRQRHFLPL
jgi:nucleoside-diphosphate-sugar epimerase